MKFIDIYWKNDFAAYEVARELSSGDVHDHLYYKLLHIQINSVLRPIRSSVAFEGKEFLLTRTTKSV